MAKVALILSQKVIRESFPFRAVLADLLSEAEPPRHRSSDRMPLPGYSRAFHSRFLVCGYAAPGSSAVSFMLALLAQHSSPIVRSKPLLFGAMQSAIG